jgi:hypothetical protein
MPTYLTPTSLRTYYHSDDNTTWMVDERANVHLLNDYLLNKNLVGLVDVNITSIQNGQHLVWNDAEQKFKNTSLG